MNYLAHLVLSGQDPQIRMGNLMGDFVTGRLEHARLSHLPGKVRLGLALHRWIDHTTDHAPVILQQVEYLRPHYGKWAPSVLDVISDFYVMRHWHAWNLGPWDAFENQLYADLSQEYQWAPNQMKPMLDSLLNHRWLPGYGTEEGIFRAVQSVQKRINHPLPLEPISDIFAVDPSRLSYAIRSFFEELLNESHLFIEQNKSLYP